MKDKFKNSLVLFVKGLKYGLIYLIFTGLIGLFYGIVNGNWLEAIFVFVAYLAIIVFINFGISIVLGIYNLVRQLQGKKSVTLTNYFIYSLGSVVLYLIYYALLGLSDLKLFGI